MLEQRERAACHLSDRASVELEQLLVREYDPLTIQTSGKALLDAYSRCVRTSRATEFIGLRVQSTEPAVRIWFLRSLVEVGGPGAMDVLIAALDDHDIYAYLGDEPAVISEAALVLVEKLFTHGVSGEIDKKQLWLDWWKCVGPDYMQAKPELRDRGPTSQRE